MASLIQYVSWDTRRDSALVRDAYSRSELRVRRFRSDMPLAP
jgi:hypothetical protein